MNFSPEELEELLLKDLLPLLELLLELLTFFVCRELVGASEAAVPAAGAAEDETGLVVAAAELEAVDEAGLVAAAAASRVGFDSSSEESSEMIVSLPLFSAALGLLPFIWPQVLHLSLSALFGSSQ